VNHPASGSPTAPHHFFACPTCKTPLGKIVDGRLTCPNPTCGHQWRVENGLYDFKEPIVVV
ncbi:MAG: hypothetical protein KJ063_25825, partial [Anaerolineae bacterium]|nr:hypothetical protein [Anaerolineae bacterium]